MVFFLLGREGRKKFRVLIIITYSISSLVLGCYAAWKWKRLAQYDDYHHPGNVKPFGFNSDLKHKAFSHSRGISDDLDWDMEMGNTVEISSPGIMAPSTPGAPSPGQPNLSAAGDDNDSNGQRSRSNSAAALMNVDTAYDPARAVSPRPASYVSVTGTGRDRRVSYNHTRDTAFDEYVAAQQSQHQHQHQPDKDAKRTRRASQRLSSGSDASCASAASSASSRHSLAGASQYRVSLGLSLKNDLDDALSAEFGWGHSRSSSADSEVVMATATGPPPAVAVAVAGGPVAAAKNVRDSLGRAPSDGSERVAMGNVPEEEEDEDEEEDRRRRKNVDEASRALLGATEDNNNDRDGITYPASLRPHRPISVVITPPPKSPTSEERSSRMTWGSAYHRS